VRSGPKTSFSKIDTLKNKERVIVINTNPDVSWALVIYRGTKLGFVYRDYLENYGKNYNPYDLETVTTKNPVNVRETASTNGKIITTKRAGDYFVDIGSSGSWCLIAFPGDQMKKKCVGYLHGEYLMVISAWSSK
jgi:uncharacterized protein YgiM (DUF1202 family)